MRVTCPSCQATYNLDERRIPPGGAKLKCTKCQSVFPIQAGAQDAVPLPSSAPAVPGRKPPPGAVPLPASSPSAGSRALATQPESPTTGVIPLPSLGLGATAGSVPRLTPHVPESSAESLSMTTGVIPLPASPHPAPEPSIAAASVQSVPRPSDRTVVFSLPKEGAPAASVALPAPTAAPAPPPLPPPPLPRAVSSRPAPAPLPPPVVEQALPPPAPAAFPVLDEQLAMPVEATPAPVADEALAPPAASPADLDFADAWGASPDPSAPGRPSFGEVELEGGDANATDFPLAEDFEPAQPGGFAWDAPAFPPPSPTPPPPTAPPSPKAPARARRLAPRRARRRRWTRWSSTRPPPSQEELEADLSAPLPRAPQKEPEPEDGLEMLGFLEEAAKETKGKRAKATRFHVRRRSGKVFGPFDEGVIGKMLGDGQLLGNEDVSTDQETWVPLGSVPGFAAVMQHLLKQPDAPAPAPTAAPAPSAPADLERLRQVYEGRMAVVSTMVDSDVEAARRKKLLRLGALAGAVLSAAGGRRQPRLHPLRRLRLEVLLPSLPEGRLSPGGHLRHCAEGPGPGQLRCAEGGTHAAGRVARRPRGAAWCAPSGCRPCPASNGNTPPSRPPTPPRWRRRLTGPCP